MTYLENLKRKYDNFSSKTPCFDGIFVGLLLLLVLVAVVYEPHLEGKPHWNSTWQRELQIAVDIGVSEAIVQYLLDIIHR